MDIQYSRRSDWDRSSIERRGPRTVSTPRRPPLEPDSIDRSGGQQPVGVVGSTEAVLYRSFLPSFVPSQNRSNLARRIKDFRQPSSPPPRAPLPRTRQRWTAALVSRNETSKMRSTMGRNTMNKIKASRRRRRSSSRSARRCYVCERRRRRRTSKANDEGGGGRITWGQSIAPNPLSPAVAASGVLPSISTNERTDSTINQTRVE
jgi:hypothetical protein